jgi:hypothetical protein
MAMPFDLVAGQWWQVPRVGNSHLADVYSPLGGPQLMTAWGGACVDTSRKDLIVAGGGHADLTDNAVYAFNFETLVWRRKVSSSAVAANDDSEVNADGSPASRHTYDSLLYDVARDSVVFAPGGFLAGPGGIRSVRLWEFAASTENPSAALPSAWTRRDDHPSPTPNAVMAFGPTSGLYFTQAGNDGLHSFNITAAPGSQWIQLTSFEGPNFSDNTVAVAPLTPNQITWVNTADSGDIWSRNLTTPYAYIGSESTGIGATGDINILDVTNPGMRWEPVLGKMLLWGGLATGGTDRRDTYRLDMTAKTVTRVAGTGDIPDAPQTNGTFGRWAYLGGCGANYSGLWVLVNNTTSDVFFFRSSGAPPVSGAPPSFAPISRRFVGWTA